LPLDLRIGQFEGAVVATGAIHVHRHPPVHRLDVESEFSPAAALDFYIHVQGLGFNRTTFGVLVKTKADWAGLAWMFPSQNATFPPYCL
jgi:hypothetical protein